MTFEPNMIDADALATAIAAGAATAPVAAPAELLVPAASLDALAARVRPAGLFLLATTVDGHLAYHDAEAESFFIRYALPLLKRQQATESPVLRAVRSLTVS